MIINCEQSLPTYTRCLRTPLTAVNQYLMAAVALLSHLFISHTYMYIWR